MNSLFIAARCEMPSTASSPTNLVCSNYPSLPHPHNCAHTHTHVHTHTHTQRERERESWMCDHSAVPARRIWPSTKSNPWATEHNCMLHITVRATHLRRCHFRRPPHPLHFRQCRPSWAQYSKHYHHMWNPWHTRVQCHSHCAGQCHSTHQCRNLHRWRQLHRCLWWGRRSRPPLHMHRPGTPPHPGQLT